MKRFWTLGFLAAFIPGCGDDSGSADTTDEASTSGAETSGSTSSSTGVGDDDGSSTSPSSGSDEGAVETTGDSAIDPDWERIEVRFDAFDVPQQETYYACIGFTVETDAVYNMVAFVPHVDDAQVTHHMVLHRLAAPMGSAPTECLDMPNSIEATWGWAPGSEPLLLPEEAGFMVGEESAQTHYALQIHYNNPLEEPGHIDSSGVDLYLTDEIRPYAAGGFVLGNVGGLTIPPGESAYEVVGNCDTTASVTAPINVFASMVHAHELGRRIWTDHLRDGTRMGDLGRADPYSFNNQGFAPLDIVIEPGDELVTHCVYDSTSRTEPTGFGFGTRDEMCFNYLLVYPRVSQPYCLN